MNKVHAYQGILTRVSSLIAGETDLIAIMATIACELYHGFDHFDWVGFYRAIDEKTLKIGPYQGTHGCLTIPFDKGVCGACARSGQTQLVNDVSKIDYHIICSSETKAEIVVPVLDSQNRLMAVLDVDSNTRNVFDEVDRTHLEKICSLIRSVTNH